jgi:HTH-type transcriptional regulator/antitoxin HigA
VRSPVRTGRGADRQLSDVRQRDVNEFDPDWVISPGETFADWIEEEGLSVRVAAIRCGVAVRDVQGILSGRVRITRSVAEQLEEGTGVSAKTWLNLERAYRDGLAAGKVDSSR